VEVTKEVANNIKTVLLLGLLTGLILFIGSLWGQGGLTIALFVSIAMNFAGYFFSDKIALSMYSAKAVTPEEAPRLFSTVEFLASRAGIPTPRIYVIPEQAPNAFATGRNPEHASVAVTEGALQLLTEEELRGVLAHELAHVKNRDILISSVAATMAGMIMWAANMARFAVFFGGGRDRDDEGGGALGGILTIILAPIAAMLIQMWISRTREYQADAGGAEIAGTPHGLASALKRLENFSKQIPMDASPSTAHMFIMHPFSGSSLMNLFSTHPPTEKRIARLLGRE
jgi:heat shock protein HtpX